MSEAAVQERVHAPTTGATADLARLVAETHLEDLPAEAVERLRGLFLDFVGVSAFAAHAAESTPAVCEAIDILDPAPGLGSVIGLGRGYNWPYAALLNGFFAHSLDFDDTNRIQTGHPGAPIFAAALADAERLEVDGRTFFEAVAVGYEVGCRVGGALGPGGYDRGFHITGVAGIFGAVATLAKLRGFDAERTSMAFGLALSKAAGSMQYLQNGSWNKRLHPGFAAQDAFICATLAESGVLGAVEAFEGKYGVVNGYTATPNPEILTKDLGRRWTFLETAIKPYPSCRLTHAAIDAALQLRQGRSREELAAATLTVDLAGTGMKIVGESTDNKRRPKTVVDAQFSIFYQVAEAWLNGGFVWSSYEHLDEPTRLAVMARMTARLNPEIRGMGAILAAADVSHPGEFSVRIPLGEPENWLGDDGLKAKFLGLAEPVYGDQAGALADRILALGPNDALADLILQFRRRA